VNMHCYEQGQKIAYYRRQAELMVSFFREFPDAWCKPGSEWSSDSRSRGRLLWSGEGADTIDKEGSVWEPLFASQWPSGIHPYLREWSEREGVHWEPYDSGTWFGYDERS